MFINHHLVEFSQGHGHKIIKTCLLQFLLTVFGTMISLCAAFVVRMIQGEDVIWVFHSLWQVFFTIAILIALRFVLAKKKAVASEKCSLEIKQSLRKQLLQKLFSLGPAFMGKERTGNIASTIATKVEYLNEYYTIYLPAAVSALLNAIILISVVAQFNLLTACMCVIGCVGMIICPMIFYFLMRERGEREMQAHSAYYSDCLDSIQGLSTLKAFNANERQREIIHSKGEELRQAVMGQLRITMLENVVLQFFAGLGSALSIAVAAWECANGNMEQAHLVYALFLIGACFAPMSSLINAWHMGYRGVVASYSIIELMDEPVILSLAVAPDQDEENRSSTAFCGNIQFSDISFAYNKKDGSVLNHISFEIPFKTTTALVGVSGSGKSTIAHLLAGFYPVDSGMLTVGDITFNEKNVSRIQNLISAVWQDCRLFYGTVEDNILIGKPDASHDEVERAAREANIHDFITTLPNGYQTMIGERGLRFSGGERQRIALARSFLRNAPILILDEATSSLDRQNEIEIQRSLQKLSYGRTCLIIAHRLATIQTADQIIILDNGRIIDKGTHDELTSSSAHYRSLMESQMAGGLSHGT